VLPNSAELGDVPGVCGVVDGSVLPEHYGIEADWTLDSSRYEAANRGT